MDVPIWFTYMLHLANGRSENPGGEYSNVVGIIQGSSVRLVLPAILDEQRAWREIQNLYMRFVILKVRNPLLFTVLRGPLYVIARSPGSWD